MTIMRVSGQNPTEEEVEAMIMASDTTGSGTVTLDEFLTLVAQHESEAAEKEKEIKEAFQVRVV